MRLLFILSLVFTCFMTSDLSAIAQDKKVTKEDKYTINVTVTNIPQGQQSLFIPVTIDTMVLDFDKVSLDGLTGQNVLGVTSTAMDKVGPGIGLLKLDDKGLPDTLKLKVYLKEIGKGKTNIEAAMVAEEPVLLAKGAKFNDDVVVSISEEAARIEVSDEVLDGKSKLKLSKNQLLLNLKRSEQKAETVFIPLIFDKSILDLDESFGHAIISPGVAAKTFSARTLHDGGPGIEVVLSEAAPKDISINVDLVAKTPGKTRFRAARPQEGHTAIISGPVVQIQPSELSVRTATVK